MVTRYDDISSRWSSLFWVKIDVFQLFSTIKVKLVYEIIQSPSLCFILHGKHKSKLPFIAILTWFLILDKMQVGGKDGDHCWWPHRPPAAPPPTEGKIVSKYCKISKTLGRVSTSRKYLRRPMSSEDARRQPNKAVRESSRTEWISKCCYIKLRVNGRTNS